jgi:hypothetical protein
MLQYTRNNMDCRQYLFTSLHNLNSEIPTAVTMKNMPTAFWDVTPCCLVEVYRRFGGTHFLHPKGLHEASTSLNM